MANHIHLVIIPKDPADFCSFLEYLKRETAHAVNKLLGRRKRTLWCRNYDSPILLDFKAAKNKIEYTYLNPTKANLEYSIDKYPGLSTWKYRDRDNVVINTKRIPRRNFSKLKRYSLEESTKELKRLLKLPATKCKLILEPTAWLKCYGMENEVTSVNRDITSSVKEKEKALEKTSAKPPLGSQALQRQPMDMPYTSEKYSPKMICLGTCRHARREFIWWFKELSNQAYKAYSDFCNKLCSTLEIPLGMFCSGENVWGNATA